MSQLDQISWSIAELPEAFESLALHTDLPIGDGGMPPKPARGAMLAAGRRWVANAAAALNLSIDEVTVSGNELEAFVANGAPAMFAVSPGGAIAGPNTRVLVLLRREGKRLVIGAPGGESFKVDVKDLIDLCWELGVPFDGSLQAALQGPAAITAKLAEVIQRTQRAAAPVGMGILFKIPPTRSFAVQARFAKVYGHVTAVLVSLFGQAILTGLAWISLSALALQGHVDTGRVIAWALLLLAAIPLQFALAWGMGNLALAWGLALRKRLLEGTFRLPVDLVRSQGVGSAVALVNECQTLEGAALNQAVSGVASSIEFISAWVALFVSPQWIVEGSLYALMWLVAGIIARNTWTQSMTVTRLRGELTSELVDRLVGHRTRVVQQPPERWHEGEDEVLAQYAIAVAAYDRQRTRLMILPRVWLALGTAGVLAYYVFSGTGATSLIGLVAVLLGQNALTTFSTLFPSGAVLAAAKKQVQPLLDAGLGEAPVAVDEAIDQSGFDATGPIVQAVAAGFEYRSSGRKVLEDVNLIIHDGDHILLEGPSGGGKTTLASLLAGLRAPTAGVLLIRGLDQHTIKPAEWRRIVASAPQFNDNHIFANTLAFNLLGSRPWPPLKHDLWEAKSLCQELGLGDLIDRMPAGLEQFVGSSGWSLSHGERSRVFIARALLQGAPLVILDESFGALDPETLGQTVDCVFRHAKSLIVIAHR